MFPPKPMTQPGAPQGVTTGPDADAEMQGMEAQARPPSGAAKIPPQFQQFVNPNDPVQAALLESFGKLGPQDVAAISAPPVLAALKKLMPCVSFVLDALASHAWAGGGKPPGAAMPMPQPGPAGGPPPMPAPGGPSPMPPRKPPQFGGMRPQTKLGEL